MESASQEIQQVKEVIVFDIILKEEKNHEEIKEQKRKEPKKRRERVFDASNFNKFQ